MGINIVKSISGVKGKLLYVDVDKKAVQIIITWHALDSMKDYSVSIEKVLEYLLFAEEIIKGHAGRFIAHRKLNNHLARVVMNMIKT